MDRVVDADYLDVRSCVVDCLKYLPLTSNGSNRGRPLVLVVT